MEWVTSSVVAARSCQMRWSSRLSRWRVISSSAPNGSSRSSTSGSIASVRAIATRWRMPPESWLGPRALETVETDEPDQVADGLLVRLSAGDLERNGDVRLGAPPGQQRRILEGDADAMLAPHRVRGPAVQADLAGARRFEAGEEPQQRRLAAARGAEQGGERSGGRGKVDARERLDFSVLQREPLGDAGGEKAADLGPRSRGHFNSPASIAFKKPLAIGRVPAGTLVFDQRALLQKMLDAAAHLLPALRMHVVGDVGDFRPLAADVRHQHRPVGHLVGRAVLRACRKQPHGMRGEEEAIPGAAREALVHAVERVDDDRLEKASRADVLDRDHRQPRPEMLLELSAGDVHFVGEEQRVLEHSPADGLLERRHDFVGVEVVLGLDPNPRVLRQIDHGVGALR